MQIKKISYGEIKVNLKNTLISEEFKDGLGQNKNPVPGKLLDQPRVLLNLSLEKARRQNLKAKNAQCANKWKKND